MIHVIRSKASRQEIDEMLVTLENYIKLAVDVRLKILAGGGALHADCEAVLLRAGSSQIDVWGADWNPFTQEVTFEALINIRPGQGNRKMEVEDPILRNRIERVARDLLGGIEVEKLESHS